MAYPASWYSRIDAEGVTRWYTLDYANAEREIVPDEIDSYLQWRKNENLSAEKDKLGVVGKEIETNRLDNCSAITESSEESSVLGPPDTSLGPIIWAAIIVSGIIIVGTLLLLFLPQSPDYVLSRRKSDDEDHADPQDAFALSSNHFLNAHAALESPRPENDWESSSAAFYANQNIAFGDLVRQIADTSQEVNITTQTEAQQVRHGKETLENLAGGLQLAIPVSRNLYFSGPIGPALSHSFQLAVTNSAVGAGSETTNTMHENSSQHAQTLNTLMQRYAAALTFIMPADSEKSRAN